MSVILYSSWVKRCAAEMSLAFAYVWHLKLLYKAQRKREVLCNPKVKGEITHRQQSAGIAA